MTTFSDWLNLTTKDPITEGDQNVTSDGQLDVVYVTLELFIAVTTTIGNACVVAVFLKYPSMKSVTNYYVLSLASADLLVGMIAIPFAITTSVGLPKIFEACLFMNSLLMSLCTSSIFSLVALSIDRYIAIIYPLQYKTMVRTKHAIIIITTSWVLAILVGLLPLMGWNKGQPVVLNCNFLEVMDLTYLVFIFAATIIVPSFFIAVVYAKIYWVVHTHLKNLATNNRATDKPEYSKTDSNAAKSLFIIVVLFVISWIPLYTLNSIMYFCPSKCPFPVSLLQFTIILSHANSMWNPFLYAWGLKDFRIGLKKLFCFRKSPKPATSNGEISRKVSYVPSTVSNGMIVMAV